ncbi:MAG: hypothetical protein IPP60_03680 [Sphingobacteriales bacterium]|nr:hypothetical protein [Sphingobacteriales bacterium]
MIAQDEIAMDASQSIVSFTEEQLSGFEKQAEQEIMDLTSQINIIAYKSNPLKKKMDAISTAMELFANEENTVEVRSIKNPNLIVVRKIREYLSRIKLLSYNNITFTAFNIRITKNLTKGEDGRYYGVISYCQNFSATAIQQTIEGKKFKKIDDTTCRDVQVIVSKDYLFGEEVWIVKLGDIKVQDYSYDK